jgi:flagellar protein FliJ
MTDALGITRLLGVRRVQEDRAAAVVRQVRERAERHEQRMTRVAESMAGSVGGAGAEPRSAMAVLAARASGAHLLAELSVAQLALRDEERSAIQEHVLAVREVRSFEKLEARTLSRLRAEELRVEQGVLDEIALRRVPAAEPETDGGAE